MLRSFPRIVQIWQDGHAKEQRTRQMRARVKVNVVHIVPDFLREAVLVRGPAIATKTRLTQMKRLRSAVLMTTPLSISPEMPFASSSNWLLKPLGAVLLSWSSPPAALSPGSLTWRKELMIACETVNCNGQQFEAIAFYSSSPQRILHCNKPANCFPFACLQSRRGVQRAAWPSAGRQSPECDHA